MTLAACWAACLLAAATLLVLRAPARPAPTPASLSASLSASISGPPHDREQRSALRRWRLLLAGMAAAGGWAFVGGAAGAVVGVACGGVAWVVLGRGEDPAVPRRRRQLLEDLPLGVDLLAACLDAGAAPERALAPVARAVGGPVAEELFSLHHRLRIGVDPVQVWQSLSHHPELGPLGRAVVRAHESGASVSASVHHLSTELRERERAEIEKRARSIEVKAAAPLGLCLLPAFTLLGVVPLVAGVFGSMRIFG